MNKWQNVFKQLNTLIHQVWAGNELWRFIASLAALLVGFCLDERRPLHIALSSDVQLPASS